MKDRIYRPGVIKLELPASFRLKQHSNELS
jgi:hypothetical protein